MSTQAITGKDAGLIKQFQDADILPDNCRRVILDVSYNDAVMIYYEVLGDERLYDIDFAAGIKIVEKEKRNEKTV